jgi:hypothetical protein
MMYLDLKLPYLLVAYTDLVALWFNNALTACFSRHLQMHLVTFYCVCRRFHGLFSRPVFLFPRKCAPPSPSDLSKYSPFIHPDDQLSDKVVIRGTTYRTGNIVITQVFSCDILEVGTILKVVVRKNSVRFLVLLGEAVRHRLGFFETLPSNTVCLKHYKSLGDFKPLFRRGDNACFPFVLHHIVVPPPLSC